MITEAQFTVGEAALDESDRFIYNSTTGGLFFDADGTGISQIIQVAQLSSGLAMTHANIFVLKWGFNCAKLNNDSRELPELFNPVFLKAVVYISYTTGFVNCSVHFLHYNKVCQDKQRRVVVITKEAVVITTLMTNALSLLAICSEPL